MISEQAKKAIDFSRKNIKPSQNEPLTPEVVKAARANADLGNQYKIPKDVKVKKVNKEFVKGEFYLIQNAQNKNDVIMFLHGGAYATGTVFSRRKLAISLGKSSKTDVFSVDYRQYPEGKHPDAQIDVYNAYIYLKDKYDKILLFGESAGATLALTLTIQLRNEHKNLPEKISVFSPIISQLNIFPSEYYRNERDPMLIGATAPVPYFDNPEKKDPLISPIYDDFHDFPPILINCGSEEVKYDNSAILNFLCQKSGVDVQWHVWQDLFHVFVLFDCPETKLAIKQIGDFFNSHFK